MYSKFNKLKSSVIGLVLLMILILAVPQSVRGDDVMLLIGGWRSTVEVPGGLRINETILQANGIFSQIIIQGPYTRYISGTYKAAAGFIQFKPIDWSPRVDAQGSPIGAAPWGASYRIVDQNHIQFFDASGKSEMAVRIQ